MILQRAIKLVVIGLVLASCEQQEKTESASPSTAVLDQYLNLPKQPYKYGFEEFNDLKVQLGRVLFYDPSLSANNKISCASCHKQQYAFGDNVAFSKGFDGGLTLRNTQPLVDARQRAVANVSGTSIRHPGGLFWDGRRASMKEAVMEPIFNHIEMGMEWISMQKKLEGIPYYAPLFEKAYQRPEITYTGVQEALAAFIGVIQSKTSRVDQQLLTVEQQKGSALFATKYQCVNCHQGRMDVQGTFVYKTDDFNETVEFANIGLEEISKDKGLELTTSLTSDEGRFRVPSLSNVAATAPYMHDGSIATLEEVIDHYSGGISAHPYLDARLKTGDFPTRFMITADEKKSLVAFLKAFTDEDVASDVRLANPFK